MKYVFQLYLFHQLVSWFFLSIRSVVHVSITLIFISLIYKGVETRKGLHKESQNSFSSGVLGVLFFMLQQRHFFIDCFSVSFVGTGGLRHLIVLPGLSTKHLHLRMFALDIPAEVNLLQ